MEQKVLRPHYNIVRKESNKIFKVAKFFFTLAISNYLPPVQASAEARAWFTSAHQHLVLQLQHRKYRNTNICSKQEKFLEILKIWNFLNLEFGISHAGLLNNQTAKTIIIAPKIPTTATS